MNKKYLISAIILIILISSILLFFIYRNNLQETSNPSKGLLIGVIKNKTITKDLQYIYVMDDKNNMWQVDLNSDTTFKKMLSLATGDKIKIKGNIVKDKEFSALEIDSSK